MSSQTQILGILMSIGDLVRGYSWEFQGNNFFSCALGTQPRSWQVVERGWIISNNLSLFRRGHR